MTHIADVIAWKFPDLGGPETVAGEITYWTGGDIPSQADQDKWTAEYEAHLMATAYQTDRDYGPISDQLDMQYWDTINGTTTWVDHVAAVKAKHKKPE